MLDELRNAVTTHWAWQAGQAVAHDLFAEPDDRHLTAAQVSTLITVVTVGIVAVIAVLIYDEVNEAAFPSADSDLANNSRLENTSSNVTDGFGDAMDLIPVVLLVLVASLVIAVVQEF